MDPITLARITGGVPGQRNTLAPPPTPPPKGAFQDALRQHLIAPVQLSAHASARLESRGIRLSAADNEALAKGIDAAAAKGARDAVLIQAERAFIVNIPNRVVITAHTSEEARARVYSGIDAAVLI